MTSPVVALRIAVRARLIVDPTLLGLLGARAIYDEAPREATLPYVTFGDVQTRDWSTMSDEGAEHFLVLHAWSNDRGVRNALAIADRVALLLEDAPLALDGHRLINLRFVSIETRRENNGRLARASLRLRAVTEAL